jgi:hypothetical protein
MRHLIITALTFCALLSAQVPTELYVNSLTGSDTANDGQSAAAPFATIGKALSEIDTAGGSIYVAPGTYSALSITSDPGFTGYVNIVSTTPLASVIRGVSINYSSAEYDTPIRFIDCQITKDGTTVYLRGAHRVQLVNCYIRPDRHADGSTSFEAVDTQHSDNVTITGCWMVNCCRGVLAYNTDDLTVYRCTIVVRQGTGISWGTNCSGGLIRLCWVTEEDYLESMGDDWLPPNLAHQSGISMRSGDLEVKQCLFTHVGGTSVMRMYPGYGRFDDVVVENCALIHNDGVYVAQITDWGYGIRFTNCTFAGGWRDDYPSSSCAPFKESEHQRYKTALHITKDSDNPYGVPASQIKVENCVMMGVLLSGSADTDGCVMWARGTGSTPTGVHQVNNWIVAKDVSGCNPPMDMEVDFFAHTGGWDFDALYHPVTDWDQVPDMRLVSTAKAWNFGLVSLQPTDSLPQVGADGRLELTWPTRSSTAHDAGAYQH